jgi:hypothetical protein
MDQAAKLLVDEDCSARIADWPMAPSNVTCSTVSVLTDLGVDIVLLLFASSFLAFAIIVEHYDQAPTADHPKATHALIAATKYVKTQRDIRLGPS